MPANLEYSAAATGLEKVSFHSNAKERQCLRMFKLPHSCTYLTHQQSNTQNYPSQPSKVCKQRKSRYSSWIQERKSNQRSNCQHPLDHQKSKKVPEKHQFLFYDYSKTFDCVDHNKLWKILKEMGLLDHLIYLLRWSRSNSQNWTWNNRLVPNRERSTSGLYIVTLLI